MSVMDSVRVKSLDNLRQVVTTDHHSFIADDSHFGGDDLGPTPHELLLAALAPERP